MLDKLNLLYLEVIIYEVLCYSFLVLLLFLYLIIIDMNFNGFDIFQNIIVFFNVWVMYYDEREWDKLYVFDFLCFLDDDGKFICFGILSYLFFLVG